MLPAFSSSRERPHLPVGQDEIPTPDHSGELARRRAVAVADYLAQRGVARGRIKVEARGDLEPVADNVTEAGRAQNRRVELVIRQIGA